MVFSAKFFWRYKFCTIPGGCPGRGEWALTECKAKLKAQHHSHQTPQAVLSV
jgi:hypothetical protein